MKKYLLLLIVNIFLIGCSSTIPKGYDPDRGILEIDRLVSQERQLFWDNCYAIFVEAGVPENECQSNLFNIIDRRHGVSFNKIQLANVADEYFFNSFMEKKIHRLIRSNPEVRSQVRVKFKSMSDLTNYYKTQYSFHKGLE